MNKYANHKVCVAFDEVAGLYRGLKACNVESVLVLKDRGNWLVQW